jgi:hypothetical protein
MGKMGKIRKLDEFYFNAANPSCYKIIQKCQYDSRDKSNDCIEYG